MGLGFEPRQSGTRVCPLKHCAIHPCSMSPILREVFQIKPTPKHRSIDMAKVKTFGGKLAKLRGKHRSCLLLVDVYARTRILEATYQWLSKI